MKQKRYLFTVIFCAKHDRFKRGKVMLWARSDIDATIRFFDSPGTDESRIVHVGKTKNWEINSCPFSGRRGSI